MCYNKLGDTMKVLKVLSILLVFLLVGCSKEKNFVCTINVDNKLQNYNITGSYKIYYKDNFVIRIEKKEKYLSNDESMLKFFEESKDLEYSNLSDRYSGVVYDIKSKNNLITIDATIDLKKFNISQMKKDGNIDKDYVVSNKLTVNGIKHIYEEKGAICN